MTLALFLEEQDIEMQTFVGFSFTIEDVAFTVDLVDSSKIEVVVYPKVGLAYSTLFNSQAEVIEFLINKFFTKH